MSNLVNARREYIYFVENLPRVKCARIYTLEYDDNLSEVHININLPEYYTQEEESEFLNKLNFDYDAGYGEQKLFGTIWFEDGSYAQRREYDGSEWWDHCCIPDIPDELKRDKPETIRPIRSIRTEE